LNAGTTLAEQLHALAGQDYAGTWEVLIADNGSADDTAQVAMEWQDRLPTIRVVSCGERHSRAFACNTGTNLARADLIAYCDADDVVSPGWLSALVSALACDGLATGPIDFARLNAPALYGWRRVTGWQSLPNWHGFLPTALGANLSVRREVFDRVGGFSESNQYGEDFNFVWRAQLSGATLGFAPEATVHWRLRSTPAAWFHRYVQFGESDVLHFVQFADFGMPRWAGQLRRWLAVAAWPMVLFESYRYLWLTEAGITVGRIRGSCRNRVLYL
jgi:glycosyltransferase involved in cell wall biosynthesis